MLRINQDRMTEIERRLFKRDQASEVLASLHRETERGRWLTWRRVVAEDDLISDNAVACEGSPALPRNDGRLRVKER